MSDYRELLLGCGHTRDKRIKYPGRPDAWCNLVTLDHNVEVHPDILCDLDNTAFKWRDARDRHAEALADDSFDEIHAYEVLEHLGGQGNHRAFFHHFSEIWRLLKPGGLLCATVPSRYSGWLWGDPSHRRAILPESLVFLDQSEYVKQLDGARKTSMSDFRSVYKADFKRLFQSDTRESFQFVLQAVKPSRWKSVEERGK